MIEKLDTEISKGVSRIEIIDNEIAGLKLKKTEIKLNLKKLYQTMLVDEQHIL